MISYTKKFYLWQVRETWFRYRFRAKDIFSLALFSHVKEYDNKPRFCVKDVSYTVELPLDKDADAILAGFRNTVRQEIRKSEKEDVVCSFKNDVDRFVAFYNDFASLKKIYPASKKMIEGMGKHFVTSFAEKDGELLAAHSYLVDEELGIARLLHSASRRLDQTYDRNIIGRANKYLTAKDIFHFKESGFKILDFGGYAENTTDKSLQGINEFKLSFGGEKLACNNYHSIVYFVLRKLSMLLDRRY